MSLMCAIRGHRRERAVWNDGLDFRSTCRWCRKPMLKDELGPGWRLFNPATDFDLTRHGKD